MMVPGQTGLDTWSARGAGTAVKEDAPKGSPGWVALPAANLLSVPVRVHAANPEQRQSAVQLELEAAGIPADDISPHRMDVVPLDPTGRDTTAAVFLSDGSAPGEVDLSRILDSAYAPSPCFHPLKAGTLSLWREGEQWVAGIPYENGRLLHAQALCARMLDADAASELACILGALELAEVLPRLEKIEVELPGGEPPPDATFSGALDLPVEVVAPRPPRAPEQSSRMLPDEVLQARANRQRQRMLLLSLSAVVLVLAAALGAFGARLYLREQAVVAEKRQLEILMPELDAVREAQKQFSALDPTLDREQFVVEMFYQLVNLLPPEGIRITRFEIRGDSLIIDGEASSPQHAIDFRGELTSSDYFKDWGFDQGFSQNPSMQDGRATFRAEGRLGSAEEGGELVASQ